MKCAIDLHIHTDASDDGSFTPEAIVEMAREVGIKTLAIADHNTCAGSIKAQNYISENDIRDIKLIPAIEMDCSYGNVNLHVLGYGIDTKAKEFAEFSHYMESIEKVASVEMQNKLEVALGIEFDRSELERISAGKTITGEVMGEALLENEQYNNLEELKPYREGGTRADNPYVNFYWDYCAQGKVAHVPIDLISLKEAIAMINKAGGIAILAHPGNNIHEDEKLLQEIIYSGVVGIETISNYHNQEQIEFYAHKARELNVISTCGSDFHGKTKPSIKMGEFVYEFDEEDLKNIFLYFLYKM